MMQTFPKPHKILLTITGSVGLILLGCIASEIVRSQNMMSVAVMYGIGIPLCLQAFDTLTDLRREEVFLAWLLLAIAIFLVSLAGYNSEDYRMLCAMSAMKAPLAFLVVYWLLNTLCYRNGAYLVNTCGQPRWYHAEAGRRITWKDVLINMILFATTFLAGLVPVAL